MSTTVTVKEQVAELPEASVARKILVVTPTGNVAPLANPPICAVMEPGQLSAPVGAVYDTTAVQVFEAALTMMEDGQTTTGS